MPRTTTFDRQQILEKAMNLFWERGYHATSVQDLVDALGINRSSLYNTFGDKHAIFVEALNYYQDQTHNELRATLQQDKPVKIILREMFRSLIEETNLDATRKGCFFVNTTTEMAPQDEEICALATENREKVEAIFQETLEKADRNGELRADQKPAALTRHFFNTYCGLQVVAKISPDKKVLGDIIEVSVSVLN